MAGTFSPPPCSIIPSRMSPFGFVGGNRPFVMPNMTSPDSWSNNPSFGMRVKGLTAYGKDVTTAWYAAWGCYISVYRCFANSSYSTERIEGKTLFYRPGAETNPNSTETTAIVMEFERPLKITNIGWYNDETREGSYHTFSISAGTDGGEEELLKQTEHNTGKKVWFNHFIPVEKQRYTFRYVIREVTPNSGWSSGRFEPKQTIKIEGVW